MPSPRLLHAGAGCWPALALLSGLLPTIPHGASHVDDLQLLVPRADSIQNGDKHLRPRGPRAVSIKLSQSPVGVDSALATRPEVSVSALARWLEAAGEATVGKCVGFREMAPEMPAIHARKLRPPRPDGASPTTPGALAEDGGSPSSNSEAIQKAGMMLGAQFVKGTEQMKALLDMVGDNSDDAPSPVENSVLDRSTTTGGPTISLASIGAACAQAQLLPLERAGGADSDVIESCLQSSPPNGGIISGADAKAAARAAAMIPFGFVVSE